MDRDPSSARLVPSLDGRHHARDALVRAVSREGAQVLSNPRRLSTVIDDELAGLPRERALLVKAVEVQVPAIIQGIVKRSGAERAVELAAATLYSLHGRDQDGCLWVAGEMARVLGYPTANNVSIDEWTGQPGARGNGEAGAARLGIRPPATPAPTRPDPAPGPPAPPSPEAAAPALTSPEAAPPASTSPEAATAPGLVAPAAEPRPAPVASSSPPAPLPAPPRAPAVEPEPVNNPYFPRGRSEPRANPASDRSQPGVPANNPYFPWSEPEPDEPYFVRVVGAPATADREAPPEPDGHEPGYQPRRRRLLRPSSVLGAIASLLLIYFALAGIFLLPPYSKAQNPPSSGVATGQGSTASARALLSYIPAGIAPQCQSSPTPNPEVVASMSCVVTDTASDTIGIVYDQFGNSGSAKGAFSTDVTPDKQSWGPTSALATAQSCDPSVNPAFNETASYTRAASATVTVSDSGQIACWVSSVQEPTIDWTSDRRMVDANAVILRPSGSAPPTAADEQALYQFWLTQAGPE